MEYISKDALVVEIERMVACYKAEKSKDGIGHSDKLLLGARIAMLEEVLVLVNTLKVKEVDLEKEIEEWLKNGDISDTRFDDYCDSDIVSTAKHFFELGMKIAQKEKNK